MIFWMKFSHKQDLVTMFVANNIIIIHLACHKYHIHPHNYHWHWQLCRVLYVVIIIIVFDVCELIVAFFCFNVDQSKGRSLIEFAVFGYSCCEVTSLTDVWRDVTLLDDGVNIYDLAQLPFSNFSQGPADLEMGIEAVINLALGYNSSQANNNATKVLVSTLNYESDPTSGSDMCKDNYIARLLESNQIHHLLLHFDSTDGPINSTQPNPISSPTPSPGVTVDSVDSVDSVDDVNDELSDLEEIQEYLSCLIQDDNLDGTTDESYVYFGYPWASTTRIEISNVINNGILDEWFTDRLYQDVSVRRLGARIAAAAYGQQPDTTKLFIVSGNVTFVEEESPQPTPIPTGIVYSSIYAQSKKKFF